MKMKLILKNNESNIEREVVLQFDINQLPKGTKYLAADLNGLIAAYPSKPELAEGCGEWLTFDDFTALVSLGSFHVLNWKDTLTEV
jgi:hypothetical protein